MAFTTVKDSYYSELIHELSNLDLDTSQFNINGTYIGGANGETWYLRASRYSQFNSRVSDKPPYDIYINNLIQQSLTEISLLSLPEIERILRRLYMFLERFEKAWKVYFKHHELLANENFSFFDFELDFFHLFNIKPIKGIPSGRVSDILFHDLSDALMFKQGALYELTFKVRELYGIPHPPGTPGADFEEEKIPADTTPVEDKKEPSTKRRKILMYFYEGGSMVDTKHKDYNDYILFCSPKNRLAYPTSLNKLKPLIRDIEAILDFLSSKARQQANNELVTLNLRLAVEK